MIHPLHERYAELLVGYCLSVQPGDNVLLNLETPALPLARALVREVLAADGIPHLRVLYPELLADVLELAGDAFLDSEPTLELAEIKNVRAWLRVAAPSNTRTLGGADKAKLGRVQTRLRGVSDIRTQETRWCGTLFPTYAGAQDAEMSLDAYERFVYGAMFLFEDDPVASWGALREEQARLIERLSRANEVRIRAEGTDLTLSVAGRTWINSDGRRNMPSGEVFTGPLEGSANGTIRFDVPSAVHGVEVAGVELTFRDGEVVSAKADKGDDLLQAQLATDTGARFLGELGIGTNYHIQRPSKSILFDEKIGGTVHLALGQSYRETGGENASAIHWDMIADLRRGGLLELDGEPLQQDGRFEHGLFADHA
jgi:aminopeptidase